MVESRRKVCLRASVLEAKATALHPERYQSSPSKLSTRRKGEAGKKKRRQSDWLANRIDRKVNRQMIDRQIEDRQTSRDKVDER